jgi:hypothetical protein
MGPDPMKRFMKKNADLVPPGEQALAVLIAEGKGGAWRRGIGAASPIGGVIADLRKNKDGQQTEGDVAQWPAAPAFWLVLTDSQLHVFEGMMGSSKAGPAAAHYPLERLAAIKLDKKLLISKLEVSFKDGTSVELDLAKQPVKPFMEAVEARLPAA